MLTPLGAHRSITAVAQRSAKFFLPRRLYSIADPRPFAAGDSVLLRQTSDRLASPIFIPRLTPGSTNGTSKGNIHHDHIIGRRVRDAIPSLKKPRPATDGEAQPTTHPIEWRLHEVTLDEYVRLTRRLVTPLYPQDAALIISLMDLHVDPPHPDHEPTSVGEKLEILEAGTGHGALTLHLSRAIHAANPAFRFSPSASPTDEDLASWKASRRAIIHTMDVSARYSNHASKVVRGFRYGMYHRNVDFHVSSVGDWVEAALAERNRTPFLSRAFLDLPSTDDYLSVVTDALRTDAMLITFNPSISQIMDCYARVKKERLPLELERVIELGVNGGSGGREWDVRAVRPRAATRKAALNSEATAESAVEMTESSAIEKSGEDEPLEEAASPSSSETDRGPIDDDLKMVCRPKIGNAIVGGGFLAVYRKRRDTQLSAET